jgi:hypothetical protein
MRVLKVLMILLFLFPILVMGQGIDHEWVNTWGSPTFGQSAPSFITVDPNGYTYVTGRFSGTMDADPGPGVSQLVTAGTENMFLCKYSPGGALVWAKAVNSNAQSIANAIELDSQGNILVTGYMVGSVDFDMGLGFHTLTSYGQDFFVAKYDSSGGLIWAKGLTSSSPNNYIFDQQPLDLAVDAAGNTYISGSIVHGMDFDPSAGTAIHTPISACDAFFAKYDPSGNYLFSAILPGTAGGKSKANGIGVDPSGNMFLSGEFTQTIDLNPGVGTANVTAASTLGDAFVSKYASNGTYTWGFRIGTNPGQVMATELEFDAAYNPIVIGNYFGTVDFDPSGSTYNLTSGGGFVVKYSTAGSFTWARQVGGGAFRPTNIATATNGDIFLSGHFNGTCDLDPGAGSYNIISLPGIVNPFYARYTSTLGFVWGAAIFTSGDVIRADIALGPTSDLHITGDLTGSADFDPGVGTNVLGWSGNYSHFFGKYANSNGAHIWAKTVNFLGATTVAGIDEVRAVTVDPNGNVFSCGTFKGTVDFDPGPGLVQRTSTGYRDVFVAKHSATGQLLWVSGVGGHNEDIGNDIGLDANGNVFVVGNFADTADFDPGVGVTTLISTGNYDGFLLRLSPTGSFLSAGKIAAGIGIDDVKSIVFDGSGQAYVCGFYSGPADFDPSPAIQNLTSTGSTSGFLAKYSNTGALISAWPIDAPSGTENILKVRMDAFGKIWVAGHCASTSIDLDPGPGVINPTWAGTTNIVIARYEPTGVPISWFAITGPGANAQMTTFEFDAYGDLVVAGYFFNAVDFDPGIGTVNLPPQVSFESFAAKYSPVGSLKWARPVGGVGSQAVVCLATLVDGSIVMGGNAALEMDLDPGPAVVQVTGLYGTDAYLIRVDSAGSYMGSMLLRSIGYESIWDIATTPTNEFMIGGLFGGQCDFDPGLGVANHFTNSVRDAFLGKYSFQCAAPILTLAGQTNVNCFGGTNGTAATNVSGGTGYTYTWSPSGGTGPTATNLSAGTYQCIVTNQCGSRDTVSVTITQPAQITSTQTASACNSYTWPVNGQTYTTSGPRTATLTSVAGCDSVITLNLTIRTNTASTQTTSACNAYTWPVNGQRYTTSGVRTATIPNTAGCDSVITLNLTIRNNTSSTQTTSACNTYTWPVNGQTYTTSGVRTATIPNTAGCDSVITLNLTIRTNTASTLTQSACTSFTLNGQTYTSAGTYTQTLTNAAGCDSTLTLVLTLNAVTAGVTVSGGTLTASPGGLTYQWIDCGNGNAPVAGATALSFTATSSGSYAVIVSDGACSDTSACEAVVGLAECGFCNGMVVFPNPFENRVTLQLSMVVLGLEMQLFDAQGKLIRQAAVGALTSEIDLTAFASGVYLMRLSANGEQKVFRLTKQ